MIREKIKSLLDRLKDERDRPDRYGLEESLVPVDLYYDHGTSIEPGDERGKYRMEYPEGAVIHYTAGRGDIRSNVSYALEKGYAYFVIDRIGYVGQMLPLNRWGYHAGKSYVDGFGHGVSKFFVGIELINAGKLELRDDGQYYTWFGSHVCDEDVRTVNGEHYEKFTKEQEAALIKLLIWLKQNNRAVFSLSNVYGHNEVSPGRKSDPGGALSLSMDDFRELLHTEYSKRYR